ncbi:hypothetical protein GGI42DRAFT_69599 [Trichoderma sp. SZMC 28013]
MVLSCEFLYIAFQFVKFGLVIFQHFLPSQSFHNHHSNSSTIFFLLSFILFFSNVVASQKTA